MLLNTCPTMRYLRKGIAFQEVPGEICLFYEMSGCPIKCPGCHSAELWNATNGTIISLNEVTQDLAVYGQDISCILFMGGDWNTEFPSLLRDISSITSLNIALYTGSNEVSEEVAINLRFLKVGPYVESLGPLSSPTTNQRFFDLKAGKNLTHLFQ